MIGWLASEFLPWLAMIAAALAGAWGYGKSRAAAARKETQHKAREQDHEKANEIRDRIERERADRLRDLDDAGWRDGD